MPLAAKRPCNSMSVTSGCEAITACSQSVSPERRRFFRPPRRRGTKLPVSSQRRTSLIALDGLTSKRRAASRAEAPADTAAMIRRRRSSECAYAIWSLHTIYPQHHVKTENQMRRFFATLKCSSGLYQLNCTPTIAFPVSPAGGEAQAMRDHRQAFPTPRGATGGCPPDTVCEGRPRDPIPGTLGAPSLLVAPGAGATPAADPPAPLTGPGTAAKKRGSAREPGVSRCRPRRAGVRPAHRFSRIGWYPLSR